MGNTCENCDKLAVDTIEFNSTFLCHGCFDEKVTRIASEIIKP